MYLASIGVGFAKNEIVHISDFFSWFSLFNPISVKSNLQSCLGSCEAVGSYLIPAILTSANKIDSKLLEQHWNESLYVFRRFAHDVIDTLAFCSILIDTIDDIVSKLRKTFDKNNVRMLLHHCEVLHEHIQQNHDDLGMTETSALRLYFDDFKVMINECKACLRLTIDLPRLRKRFSILLSVLKKIEKFLESHTADEGTTYEKPSKAEDRPFTFGHVTAPNDSKLAAIATRPISDSLEMAIDLDEFISKNGSVMHGSVFYDTKKKRCKLQTFTQNSSKIKGDVYSRKDGIAPKRASKRT